MYTQIDSSTGQRDRQVRSHSERIDGPAARRRTHVKSGPFATTYRIPSTSAGEGSETCAEPHNCEMAQEFSSALHAPQRLCNFLLAERAMRTPVQVHLSARCNTRGREVDPWRTGSSDFAIVRTQRRRRPRNTSPPRSTGAWLRSPARPRGWPQTRRLPRVSIAASRSRSTPSMVIGPSDTKRSRADIRSLVTAVTAHSPAHRPQPHLPHP